MSIQSYAVEYIWRLAVVASIFHMMVKFQVLGIVSGCGYS